MEIQTIEWSNQKIKIVDQTKLPLKLEYLYIKDVKSLWQAIKKMQIRGAPALGAAAGWGMYLGIKDSKARHFSVFSRQLDRLARYLASSRPTARNLFWGIERICSVAVRNKHKSIFKIKRLIFKEAEKIAREDKATCRRIGYYGSKLVKSGDRILTLCNAGIFATIDYGTALGVIYRAKADGKKTQVYVCETRPILQGARLSAWELKKNGIDVTLICDNMAATLMKQGKIDKVITGADRIAANGDTANKIGTYNLAVLSNFHHIPFYVAAPRSTFDLSIKTGAQIVIEERPASEVSELFFKKPIAPKGVQVFNPAFDVTPHNLITALITDKGIIKPPDRRNISAILKR
jgi:methylthioribose-1-phosphate isomerase